MATTCPVTRTQFAQHAAPLAATIAGTPVAAAPKEFSTGSLGWYNNGKIVVTLDGIPTTVQVGLLLTIVGSKELPPATAPAPAPVTATPAPEPAPAKVPNGKL